ncbi:MAG: hypothetical protein EKK41_12255 [Hyphomicrobiales bacterium]|jgi:hypothetical protein|nr:MAG: hypothetical protein EKK41_12255 [Hyphomicrobiales bacterium]
MLVRRRLPQAVCAVALSAVVAGMLALGFALPAHAEGDWQTVKTEDKAIETELPAPPKYEAVQLLSGQGFPYIMHQYVAEADVRVFQVQTAVYPKDVYITPQVNIQGGLDAAAKSLEGGKWANVNWTRHQGLVAADAVGSRAGQEIRMFSLLKGMRLVTLTYVGPPETARSEPVERFIKSLKVQ